MYTLWWFSPWELWGYWLVHIVVPPSGLQTPSAPWVLSLAPSLGTLCPVQWQANKSTSVFVKHWQILSGGSHNRILSASTCWHPQQCLGLVMVYGMDPQVGQSLDGLSFSLCSTLCPCISPVSILFPYIKRTETSTLWLILLILMPCKLLRRVSS